jgi:glutamate-1-semialdehyde 2,1-aminomutase
MTRTRDRELRDRARKVIPDGMYGHQSVRLLPEEFPQFFSKAKGARLWDVDGNEYVDYVSAFGPNLFGYGFEPVDRAAAVQQARGDTLTGPSEVMVELAEAFVGMVSHADWAIFCKDGSDATTMALVVARAHTGRKTILVARHAYHGSAQWCTPRPAGILPEDRAHIVYFNYNDADNLTDAVRSHAGDVAAIFATPFRQEVFHDQTEPNAEFARAARALCDESGALLVVDDVRAGFRLERDCSWARVGVRPDLSTWGKCIANGYALSALLGAEKARRAASEIYVTGSFWFSATAMAAALETLRQVRESGYLEHIIAVGQRLREGLQRQAAAYGFSLRQTGPVQMPQILFNDDPDMRVGYAWTGECVSRGVYLHPYHNMFLSAAHGDEELARTFEVTDLAFASVKQRRAALRPVSRLAELLRPRDGAALAPGPSGAPVVTKR